MTNGREVARETTCWPAKLADRTLYVLLQEDSALAGKESGYRLKHVEKMSRP